MVGMKLFFTSLVMPPVKSDTKLYITINSDLHSGRLCPDICINSDLHMANKLVHCMRKVN